MASARQIAANRENAKKSTGPKSDFKKSSGKNAYRHGLSVPISTTKSEAQLKYLARQFAGNSADVRVLTLATIAANAHLDLMRIRGVQTAMIERPLMFRASHARLFGSCKDELRHHIGQTYWPTDVRGENLPQPEIFYPSTPLAGGKDEEERRFAETVRQLLPNLTKICRYEKRAANRRDRAIGEIASIKSRKTDRNGS